MACKRKAGLSEEAKKILAALAQDDQPRANKELAQVTGLDSKKVSSTMCGLKKKGLVESPVRCKYIISDAGKAELN